MSHFLRTGRLTFRPLTCGDLDFLAEMLGDPLVMRFYPRVLDRQEAQNWLDRAMERQARDGYSFWLVADINTDEPIGQVGLLKQEADGIIENEIGYMLHRRYWRKGFATEAASAVRDYAFEVLGKDRVISLIRPLNIPSQRVAISYGAKPEKLIVWNDLDHLVFALRNPRLA